MNRRTFMAALGTGAAVGSVASSSATARQAPTISSYVTNVRDVFGVKQLPVGIGDKLRLWLDSSRKYDADTVVVGTEGKLPIGYLPPIHGRLVGPLIANGLTAQAEVEKVRNSPRPALRIAVSIHAA